MSSSKYQWPKGMVYIMTNSARENEVAAFRRAADGTLKPWANYPTGGRGTGTNEVSTATPNDGIDPLASQGSLVLSQSGRFLFAVNAGSNTITSFRVMFDGGLVRASVVSSGGLQPNSLDVHRNLLYVSNVGSSENNYASNITGFSVNRCGVLTMIPGSTRSLSTENAQPACVRFSPLGNQLIVTELTTSIICVYQINSGGTAALQGVNASSGAGPFGVTFLSDHVLLVAEAGANALSSYRLDSYGGLNVISASAATGQLASCWVSIAENRQRAYVSNTGSGTVSLFRTEDTGVVAFLENIRTTPGETALGAPIDNGVSPGGHHFYVLNGNQGTISVFTICQSGILARVQVAGAGCLPVLGAQGLAVV